MTTGRWIAGALLAGVLLPHTASAVVVDQAGGVLEHSRELDLTGSATVKQFYRAKAAGDSGDAHHYLGLKARSSLPARHLSAWLELSAVTTPGGVDSFDTRGNQVVRLGMRDRIDDVDLTVRYFSIGDAVAGNPLARNHLASLGLPARGEGAQVRASWQKFGIDVTPEVTWRWQPGNGSATQDVMSVRLQRRIGEIGSLEWQLRDDSRSHISQNETTISDSESSTLSLSGSTWRVYWQDLAVLDRREAGGAVQLAARTTEFGAKLQLADNLEVVPRYRVTHQDGTANWSVDRLAGMRISAQWQKTPQMSLNIELKERLGADLEQELYTASLAAHRWLRLEEDRPPSLLVTTSLSYRGQSGGAAAPAEGVSFEVSLEFNPRGG